MRFLRGRRCQLAAARMPKSGSDFERLYQRPAQRYAHRSDARPPKSSSKTRVVPARTSPRTCLDRGHIVIVIPLPSIATTNRKHGLELRNGSPRIEVCKMEVFFCRKRTRSSPSCTFSPNKSVVLKKNRGNFSLLLCV